VLDEEVTIVGAGLAGLSAAITLQSAGCAVRVVEASDRVGGRVASDHIDGFTLDRGFQLINANYPELERLGATENLPFITLPRVIDISIENNRVALGDPRIFPLAALDTRSGSLLSKMKFLGYLLSHARSNSSVEDEMKKLGSLYTTVLRPFLSGVFLTSPANVDAISGKEIVIYLR
jgi:phytoene dehydrogenase-like protein